MLLHNWSFDYLATHPLPGPSTILYLADHTRLLPTGPPLKGEMARRDFVFADCTQGHSGTPPATRAMALDLLRFIEAWQHVPHLVIVSLLTVSAGLAVQAALNRIAGNNPRRFLRQGTHHRLLYRVLLQAADLEPPAEPLVSLAVSVWYPADRLHALLLSLQRQRHTNWEVIALTDGPHPEAVRLVEQLNDPRVHLIENREACGHWCHPYRQRAFECCRGDFIGQSNDDNLYVAGYLEQKLWEFEDGADLVLCDHLHWYSGWQQIRVMPRVGSADLGCWLARASLVRQCPWDGTDWTADGQYVERLAELAGPRIGYVRRPLFVKN